ncbi:MAG: hypothetical protein ACKOXF_04560 [Chitinophagaceae bacterium]
MSKVPLAREIRDSSSDYDLSLFNFRASNGECQVGATSKINSTYISEILVSTDTPPPVKENPKINSQNVDSLKISDQEASGYNRHQSGSKLIDTLEDLWDAGGIGKDAILIAIVFVLAGIWVLIFGPINQ